MRPVWDPAARQRMDAEALLARFGLSNFRPGQRDVIDAVQQGHDLLCVMPTGGGKSLCYQLPSLQRTGTTIVVSPLIALMKDQIDSLQQLGIEAELINSSLSISQQASVMDRMAAGELDLVYVAPERLRNGRFLERVRQANITLLAVDEAHCVSEWGHDFRPDYARLGRFRDRYLSGVQTIALTATATPTVRDDVCALLNFKSPKVFVTGFARANLHFAVTQTHNEVAKQNALVSYIQQQSGAGIIYAATRKRCEDVAQWLPQRTKRDVGVYHAGMHPDERRRVQEAFMAGDLSVIVATNAFGMGIDKSDIRFVVHYNLPGSLEAYYQEAGRAGRDGQSSDCVLLFALSDRQIQEFFIENRYPSQQMVQKVYEYLLSREEDPIEMTLDEVRAALGVRESSEAIGTSETLLARSGVLKRLDSGSGQAVVRIDSDAPTMLDFLPREAKLKRKVMSAIEAIVGSRRGEDVFVRPITMAQRAGVSRDQLSRALRELQRLNSFDYVPPFRGRAVHFIDRDRPFASLEIDFDELQRRKDAEYEKLDAVIAFARATKCRQRVILDYFGDPNAKDCGQCDRCDPAVAARVTRKAGTDSSRHESVVTAAELKSGGNQAMSETMHASLVTAIRVVLSGVTRTHGRLGKHLIAQMLAGSKNKKITQMRLDRLSTYGMLSGLKQSEVVDTIDALLAIGLLDQREVTDRRPTVSMTEAGRRVMNAVDSLPPTLQLRLPLARKLAAKAECIEAADVSSQAHRNTDEASQSDELPRVSPQDHPSHGDASDRPVKPAPEVGESLTTKTNATVYQDTSSPLPAELMRSDLMDRIKRYRRKRSVALNVPPHRILSGSTIERIADRKPANSAELEVIEGVTAEFMDACGSDVLELIATTVAEFDGTDLQPNRASPTIAASSTVNQHHNDRDVYWVKRLTDDGYTIAEIAEIRGVSLDTVRQQLRNQQRTT
ncbi:MAG: RecQ family ATP-dependent DNA helicase [Planctomycetota bacterium]